MRFIELWLQAKPSRGFAVRPLDNGNFELIVYWNDRHKFYEATTIEQLVKLAEADLSKADQPRTEL